MVTTTATVNCDIPYIWITLIQKKKEEKKNPNSFLGDILIDRYVYGGIDRCRFVHTCVFVSKNCFCVLFHKLNRCVLS